MIRRSLKPVRNNSAEKPFLESEMKIGNFNSLWQTVHEHNPVIYQLKPGVVKES
jgi:hypothetical protein